MTTLINILKASSLLKKTNLNCTNSDQNEIDSNENRNSVWLSTEQDDIDVSLTENSIRLSTEWKRTTENEEVKVKRLVLWPESQPSALKIQKGQQTRQDCMCSDFCDTPSYYALSFCEVSINLLQ